MKGSLIYTNKIEKNTLTDQLVVHATQKLPFRPERPSQPALLSLYQKRTFCRNETKKQATDVFTTGNTQDPCTVG